MPRRPSKTGGNRYQTKADSAETLNGWRTDQPDRVHRAGPCAQGETSVNVKTSAPQKIFPENVRCPK